MKHFKNIVAVLLLLPMLSHGQSRIVADISNLRNDKGVCRACLFNNKASFDGEMNGPLQCIVAPVKNLAAELIFNNVPAGIYAIFVFHDANDNNKMDKNFIGIPREGYGASNNKLPFTSAPGYDANKFAVANNTIIKLKIRLRNL